ncbi:hypothetical protein EOM82_05425 [bacterium]|nr:hypothetical protein [bacterium]
MCEEIMVDSVICSDSLCLHDCEKNILIPSVTIPEGSTIKGTINVSVLECRPVIDLECCSVKAAITLFIEKDLTVATPEGNIIPLEYGFRIERLVKLKNCCPSQLKDVCNVNGLKLHIFDICVKDEVSLHPSTEISPASFDEKLTVYIDLKLVVKKQISLQLCKPCDCPQQNNCGQNLFPLAAIFPFFNKGSPYNPR